MIGANQANQNTTVLPPSEYIAHAGNVLIVFWKELFLSANWHLMWFLFFLILPRVADWRKTPAGFLLAVTVVVFLLSYILLGTFTGIYVSIVGEGSSAVVSRGLVHVCLLISFVIIMGVGEASGRTLIRTEKLNAGYAEFLWHDSFAKLEEVFFDCDCAQNSQNQG